MPRKPTLSPSRISTFLACPVLYRWTYVHPQPFLKKANPYFSFGLSLHRTLERFHAEPDRGVDPQSRLMALYEESWIDTGFRSADERAEAFVEGKEILEAIHADDFRLATSAQTISVEKTLRRDMGDFVLVGRIDRLDEHDDGTLEIVDYKSLRSRVTPEDVAADIAMSVYQYLLRQVYPDRPIKATILALAGRESASYSMSEADMETLEQDLLELGRRILSIEQWDAQEPVLKPMCGDCDYVRLCRQCGDFNDDWVARRSE